MRAVQLTKTMCHTLVPFQGYQSFLSYALAHYQT